MPEMNDKVKLSDIKVGKRFRVVYKNMDMLVNSIKRFKLLQPLLVDSDLNLIAGGRRYKAAETAGLKEVPVIIRAEVTELQRREMELEENLQREDLTFTEEVKAKREIDLIKKELYGDKEADHSKTGWSTRQTALFLGESVSGVSQDIQLAEAMEHFPELEDCKTKDEAHKLLKKMGEALLIEELTSRRRTSKSYLFAESNYIIGDALKEMEASGQTAASFAEVDPPYGVDLPKVVGKGGGKIEDYEEIPAKIYPKFTRRATKAVFNLLNDNSWCIWWFAFRWYDTVHMALKEAGFAVDVVPAIWFKEGGAARTQAPDMWLGRAYEQFFVCRKGTPSMAKRGRANIFSFPQPPAGQRIHPAEKPVELMDEILDIFTFPNTITVIPFLGSGVTLRSVYKRGQSGWGYELCEGNKKKFLVKVLEEFKEE